MKLKLALVAKEIIISHDSGVPSAIGIMERINAESFPTLFPQLGFLTVWKREPGEPDEFNGQLVVQLGATELLRDSMSLSFRGNDFTRTVIHFQGLVIPAPGELEFRCEFEGLVVKYQISVVGRSSIEKTSPEVKETEFAVPESKQGAVAKAEK